MDKLGAINRWLSQPGGVERHYDVLVIEMSEFLVVHKNLGLHNQFDQEPDEMRPILSSINMEVTLEMEMLMAKILKILLRSPTNRRALGKQGLSALVQCLQRQVVARNIAAGEIANVILNACYNGENVTVFVEVGGVEPLSMLLRSRDMNVIASALGALQGICYVPAGRYAVRRDLETMLLIGNYLSSQDELVSARAAGCVHNISADPASLGILREAGCILPLLTLLRDHSPEVCQAAAGALQNMSRETASREIIVEADATPLLLDLLFSSDVKCQVASIGAIMNIMGPSLEGEKLEQLRETLTNGLVMGVIESCMFDK